jgi:hypothetical protein
MDKCALSFASLIFNFLSTLHVEDFKVLKVIVEFSIKLVAFSKRCEIFHHG